jgi:hypothetical protein
VAIVEGTTSAATDEYLIFLSGSPSGIGLLENEDCNHHGEIIFMLYWGAGPAEKLATGFKAAVDELGKHGATAASR